jgi:hypothetical protein
MEAEDQMSVLSGEQKFIEICVLISGVLAVSRFVAVELSEFFILMVRLWKRNRTSGRSE